MERKKLSQEGLKLIACVTMLLDHIGAALVPYPGLRVIGRLAFPIYCFLLAEGAARTGSPKKYALRLAAGALLSEIPFDLLFFGSMTWAHQSVMVTLLLGLFAVFAMERVRALPVKLLVTVPFVLAAELLGTDYGGYGVWMAALFALTRQMPDGKLLQAAGLAALCWLIGGYRITLGPLRVPIEMFAMFSLIPISLYSGRKTTSSRVIQWIFYLFYPVHMAVLLAILQLLF